MKKTLGLLVAMVVLLVFCLMPKAEASSKLGVFVGPAPNFLKELNEELGELNKELGTSFKFNEGLMYSLVFEGDWMTRDWRKGISISVCQAKTKDTIYYHWAGNQKDEVDTKLGLVVLPIFLSRIYEPSLKGRLSPRLELGLGVVTTFMNIYQETRTYFRDQDGNIREVKGTPNQETLITPALGVQVSAGVEYKLGKLHGYDWFRKRKSIVLEVRYISSKIKIQDPKGSIEISLDWSEFSFWVGLIIEVW